MSLHAANRRAPDTTLCSAVEKTSVHTEGEQSARDLACATSREVGVDGTQTVTHTGTPSLLTSFLPSFIRISPHSTARASTERVESHDTALAQQSLSNSVFAPVGVSLPRFLPSSPLRVRRRHLLPLSLLCLPVLFLSHGGGAGNPNCHVLCVLPAGWTLVSAATCPVSVPPE